MSYKLSKEESELYDALSREFGEPMSPYEELVLLGIYEAEWNEEPYDESDGDYEIDEGYEISYDEGCEEYEFDAGDEQYRMLAEVLWLNNDKRKHFA